MDVLASMESPSGEKMIKKGERKMRSCGSESAGANFRVIRSALLRRSSDVCVSSFPREPRRSNNFMLPAAFEETRVRLSVTEVRRIEFSFVGRVIMLRPLRNGVALCS